jgi:hypothetical protein
VATLQPSDFTVNGRPADAVALSPDGLEASFTFNSSPVTGQGPYRMHMDAGAVHRRADAASLRGYDAVFYHDTAEGRVVSMSPPDLTLLWVGADGRTPEITVRFSEPIDPASVGPDDLAVAVGPGAVRVTSARAVGNDSAAYTLGGFDYDGPLIVTPPPAR